MQLLDPSVRVGVVRGGYDPGHFSSLKHGGELIKEIERFGKLSDPVSDIIVSQHGEWFRKGRAVRPEVALFDVDLVWDVTHNNPYSNIHTTLLHHNVKLVGSRHHAKRRAARKSSLLKAARDNDLTYQNYFVIDSDSLYAAPSRILSNLTLPFYVGSNFISSRAPKSSNTS